MRWIQSFGVCIVVNPLSEVMVSEKNPGYSVQIKKIKSFLWKNINKKRSSNCKSSALGMTSIWHDWAFTLLSISHQRQGFLSHGPRLLRGGCPDNGSLHPRRLEGPSMGYVGWINSRVSKRFLAAHPHKGQKCQREKSSLHIHYIDMVPLFSLVLI